MWKRLKVAVTLFFMSFATFGTIIDDARAQCALPYILTNGSFADATQVMGNFNALVTCLGGTIAPGTSGQLAFYPSSGSSLAGENLSALIDSSIGSTRGAILERGASGWVLLPPGPSTYVLTSTGSGADPAYVAAAGGGLPGGGSQYAVGIPPLASFTEFPGGTGANAATYTQNSGVAIHIEDTLNATGDFPVGLAIPAPATPYFIAVNEAFYARAPGTDNSGPTIGFSDSVKFEGYTFNTNALSSWATATTGSSSFSPTGQVRYGNGGFPSAPFRAWIGLGNNGTTISYAYSMDGVNWMICATYPVSSGFVSSYSDIFIGIHRYNADNGFQQGITFYVYDPNGASRGPGDMLPD